MDSTFCLTLAQGQSATDFLEEHDGDIDAMVDVITDESTRNALDAIESYNTMLRHFFAFECRVEALRHLRALMNDESLTAIQRYHVCRLVMQFSFDEPGPRPARRKTVARDHAATDSPRPAVHSVKKVAEDERPGKESHDAVPAVIPAPEPVPAQADAGIESRSESVQCETLDSCLHGNDEVNVTETTCQPRAIKRRRRGRFRSKDHVSAKEDAQPP